MFHEESFMDTISQNQTVHYPSHAEYQIGGVTYEVSACFLEEGKTLKDCVLHTLLQEVCNHPNGTFANTPKYPL